LRRHGEEVEIHRDVLLELAHSDKSNFGKAIEKSARSRRQRSMSHASVIGRFRRMTLQLPVNCFTCVIRQALISSSKVAGWLLRTVRPILQR
jgi:hypothetical protein